MILPKKLIRLTGPKGTRKARKLLEDAINGDPAIRAELEKAGTAAIREQFALEARNIGRAWQEGVIEEYEKTGVMPLGEGGIAEMERAAITMHEAGRRANTPKA